QFIVDSYEFDLTALMPGASSASHATFSPLVLDLAPTAGLADLLAKAASGQPIDNVTFFVTKQDGESTQTIETIKLEDVSVIGFAERSGFDTRVALGYRTIQVDDIEQKPDGSLGAEHIFQRDLAASGDTIAPVTEADLTPGVATASSLDYFLKVDGI